MIRREIQLPGQPPQWLLISQVEHARISGLLAEHCLSHFDKAVREELMQAIVHHDDGWETWDAKPQLDAKHFRPLSFRELPLEVSLPIWTRSIEAVSAIGVLATWVVSGHFLALLQSSDKPRTPATNDWQQQWVVPRSQMFAVWQAINPTLHTQALADEALCWLQLLDVMSLWLCSACPGEGEQVVRTPKNYHVGQGQLLETEFCYEQNHVRIKPWRLDVPSLSLEATGWLVPVREYNSTDELLAARVAHSLRWQLTVER